MYKLNVNMNKTDNKMHSLSQRENIHIFGVSAVSWCDGKEVRELH